MVNHRNSFGIQQRFHSAGALEMVLARQHAISVYHAVGGYGRLHMVRGIHGPANSAGRLPTAQIPGNGAVAAYSAGRNLPHHLVHQIKKIIQWVRFQVQNKGSEYGGLVPATSIHKRCECPIRGGSARRHAHRGIGAEC